MMNPTDPLFNTTIRSALDGAFDDQDKEALSHVDPRTACGSEVHVPARALCQPGHDDVNVKIGWDGRIDGAQEA